MGIIATMPVQELNYFHTDDDMTFMTFIRLRIELEFTPVISHYSTQNSHFYVILEISTNFRIANFYSVHMKDIPNEPTVRELIQSWNDNTIGHTHRHTEDASEAATSEIKINNPSRDTNMPFQGC